MWGGPIGNKHLSKPLENGYQTYFLPTKSNQLYMTYNKAQIMILEDLLKNNKQQQNDIQTTYFVDNSKSTELKILQFANCNMSLIATICNRLSSEIHKRMQI